MVRPARGTGFRPCHGCPDRTGCAAAHFAGAPRACADVLAADRGPADAETPASLVEPPVDPPMTLREAAEITVRHWRQLGARGFDAAITLLERVLARS